MFSDLFRVGRDAELRYTTDQIPVANVPLAYDIGFGDRKRTGWIEVVIWGKRAETLTPMLTKGSQLYCDISDIEAEAYTPRSGGDPKAKLKGRLVDLRFAGARSDAAPATNTPTPAPKPTPAPDVDDDTIPF